MKKLMPLFLALSCDGDTNLSTPVSDQIVVKIGVIAPLQGELHERSEELLRVLELANKQVNKGAMEVQFVPKDGGCDAQISKKAALELIQKDHVEAILGGFCSVETLGAATVSNDNKVILISSGSNSDSITQSGEYVYRTSPPWNVLASVFPVDVAQHILAHDPQYLSFDSFLDSKTAIPTDPIIIDAADIYFLEEKLLLLESEHASTPYLLGASVYSNDFLDVVARHKKILEGASIASSSPDTHNPGVNDFVDSYTDTYHVLPKDLEVDLHTYDAFSILFNSFCSAENGSITNKEYLDHLGTFQGIAGPFRFDKNGDPHYENTRFTIKDGTVIPYSKD